MRRLAPLISAFALLALAACGQRSALAPQPGKPLPPAPYGRAERPTPSELLKPPTIAIPERSVELRTRSEQRDDDAFDLPPAEPAQTQPAPSGDPHQN